MSCTFQTVDWLFYANLEIRFKSEIHQRLTNEESEKRTLAMFQKEDPKILTTTK